MTTITYPRCLKENLSLLYQQHLPNEKKIPISTGLKVLTVLSAKNIFDSYAKHRQSSLLNQKNSSFRTSWMDGSVCNARTFLPGSVSCYAGGNGGCQQENPLKYRKRLRGMQGEEHLKLKRLIII